MGQSVTSFVQTVSKLLFGTQVTDRNAVSLSLDEGAGKAVEMVLQVGSASRKVMLIGNGGSAAIVSHMQSDLSIAVGVRAMVFTDTPLLTALSNDLDYDCVYEQGVQLWAEPGDLLLAISSSGQSGNILRAVRASVDRGCQVVTLSGFGSDNPLRRLGDVNFHVPSEVYGEVEAAHATLAHFLVDSAAVVSAEMRDSGG